MRLPLTLPARDDRPFDVLAAGLNSVDLVPVVEQYPPWDGKAELLDLAERTGGQTATTAVAVARLGWRTRYVGRVGDDRYGRLTLDALSATGVDVTAVRIVPGARSRCAVVLVERRTGARTVLWQREAAVALQPGDATDAMVAGARLVHGDCQDPLALADIARRARAQGACTVLDIEAARPGTDALLAQTDVVIATGEFATTYTGQASLGAALAALQAGCGAAIVCVTLGPEGSLARCAGREIRTPGYEVDVVDTTGAGDVFRAGFIAGWLRGGETAELEDVLRYANASAALACRALGAMAAVPSADDVEALMVAQALRPASHGRTR